MTFEKKDVRKIKKATKEELNKLQQEYKAVMGSVNGMSPFALLLVAVIGIATILYFQSNLLDLLGLVLLLYPMYTFVQRGAHREGYFEGFYEMMTRASNRVEPMEPEKSSQE